MATPVTTSNIQTWLQRHERLVLTAIAGVVLWFSIGRIDTLIQNHDNANLQQAKVVAVAQAEKTQELAAQAESQAAQFQALAEKVQLQNAALEQANVTLATALAKQQKTDATLPPSDLVARWNTLVPQASTTVTPSGVTLPSAGAVATVQALEQVPVLQTEVSNTKVQLDNVDALLASSGQQVTTLNTEVGSLRLQLGDDAKVCSAQIATVKAAARRSKRRWFYAGLVAGFIGRQLIKP